MDRAIRAFLAALTSTGASPETIRAYASDLAAIGFFALAVTTPTRYGSSQITADDLRDFLTGSIGGERRRRPWLESWPVSVFFIGIFFVRG